MGRKHNVSVDMLADLTSDITGTITSRVLDTSEMDKASIHLKWVAGPIGTFAVWVRNNAKDDYYTLDFGSPISIGGSEAQILLTEMPFVNMYFVYTPSSGSGTLTAYCNTKTVGA